jgi:MFS family permease
MGSLSDLLGRRKLYVTGFFISGAGALVSGLAPNLLIAIIFRSLQGVGGAMVQSNALAIMITVFPQEKRGLVIGTYITVVGVSSVVGPIVGGIIVEQFSWRLLLIYPAPLLLVAEFLSLYVLPDIKPVKEKRSGKLDGFDWQGSIILCLALLSIMLTVTNGPRLGWLSPVILVSIILSLLLTALFMWQQRNSTSPLIPTEFYKHKTFTY